MSKRCSIWSGLCIVVFSVLPAVAQTQAGISGVIHDPSSAVIPGVSITVTNPGTNKFHGTLFEFLRNDKLDAKQYAFAGERPKDPFKWNQYGFALGGPVWLPHIYKGTDRLFFMSNYEGFKERRLTRQLFTVPSVKMRNGDLSEVSNPIYDPLNRTQQFPGNKIDPSRFHPTSVKLLEFYPAPNLNPGLVPFNYEATLNRRSDKDQFIQRIDFVESSKSNWFGRYSWGSETEVSPVFYQNAFRVSTTVHQAMFSNTRVLST